jgi:hypothetical protein
LDIGAHLRLADLSGNGVGPERGAGSEDSHAYREDKSHYLANGDAELELGPVSRLVSRLSHAPLSAQIGVFALLWALAIGPVFAAAWLFGGRGVAATNPAGWLLCLGALAFVANLWLILNLP